MEVILLRKTHLPQERCTSLFAKMRTSLFANCSTFLFAKKRTLLFAVYKRQQRLPSLLSHQCMDQLWTSLILQNQYKACPRVVAQYEVIYPCGRDIALNARKTGYSCIHRDTSSGTLPTRSVLLHLCGEVHSGNKGRKNTDRPCGIPRDYLHPCPVIHQDNSLRCSLINLIPLLSSSYRNQDFVKCRSVSLHPFLLSFLPSHIFSCKEKNSTIRGGNLPECQTAFFPRWGQYAGMSGKNPVARGVNCPEWGVD